MFQYHLRNKQNNQNVCFQKNDFDVMSHVVCEGSVFGSCRINLNPRWFKLYFICIIYDKYTNSTQYNYDTTTIQIGFRRKSNDLFESVSQEFTLLIYVLSCRNCHL